MPLLARSRWALIAACATLPAVVLLTACGSDSTSPKSSVPSVDTVAIDQSTAFSIEHYHYSTTDSGYQVQFASENGNYVETYWNGGSYWYDYRMFIPFALPTLSGRAVVDSAKVYQYVCYSSGALGDSIVVDHVNWGAVAQDSVTFFGQTLQANIGTFAHSSDSTGWRSMPVTSAVQADYAAKRASSQFRFAYLYSTLMSGDHDVGFGGVYCGNAGSGNGYLVIWSH